MPFFGQPPPATFIECETRDNNRSCLTQVYKRTCFSSMTMYYLSLVDIFLDNNGNRYYHQRPQHGSRDFDIRIRNVLRVLVIEFAFIISHYTRTVMKQNLFISDITVNFCYICSIHQSPKTRTFM